MKYYVDENGCEYAGDGDILYTNILDPLCPKIETSAVPAGFLCDNLVMARITRICQNNVEITALNKEIAEKIQKIQKLVNLTSFLVVSNQH